MYNVITGHTQRRQVTVRLHVEIDAHIEGVSTRKGRRRQLGAQLGVRWGQETGDSLVSPFWDMNERNFMSHGKRFQEYGITVLYQFFISLRKWTHPLGYSDVWVLKARSTTEEKSGLPQQYTGSAAHCPHQTEPAPAGHWEKTTCYVPVLLSYVHLFFSFLCFIHTFCSQGACKNSHICKQNCNVHLSKR